MKKKNKKATQKANKGNKGKTTGTRHLPNYLVSIDKSNKKL